MRMCIFYFIAQTFHVAVSMKYPYDIPLGNLSLCQCSGLSTTTTSKVVSRPALGDHVLEVECHVWGPPPRNQLLLFLNNVNCHQIFQDAQNGLFDPFTGEHHY